MNCTLLEIRNQHIEAVFNQQGQLQSFCATNGEPLSDESRCVIESHVEGRAVCFVYGKDGLKITHRAVLDFEGFAGPDDTGNGREKSGVMAEIFARLESLGACGEFSETYYGGRACDVEAMKLLLETLCEEAGVTVQFHTRVVAAGRDTQNRLSVAISAKKFPRNFPQRPCTPEVPPV